MFSADCNSYNDVWVFVYEQKRISITQEWSKPFLIIKPLLKAFRLANADVL